MDRADPEPKALACYGLWLPARERTLLRFVNGRPISPVTCVFLAWVAEQLAAEDVRVLALIWDNASWHISRELLGDPGEEDAGHRADRSPVDEAQQRPLACRQP